MSIPPPYYSPLFPIKQENDPTDQPLDLSFNSLEKKVIQQFKDQISIQQISKRLNLSIDEIYSIISKTSSIKIKCLREYTKDIKYRVKEAQNEGKSLSEIAEIFKLKPHQMIYINRSNRTACLKQLCHCVNAIPNKGPSLMTIEKLKEHLRFRCIPSFKRT